MNLTRTEMLLLLADQYGIAVRDSYESCGDSAEEDLMEMLQGDVPVERYALVTTAGEFNYITTRSTLDAVQKRAVEYVDDDIYAESPVEIVDLDSGRRKRVTKFVAIWSRWS